MRRLVSTVWISQAARALHLLSRTGAAHQGKRSLRCTRDFCDSFSSGTAARTCGGFLRPGQVLARSILGRTTSPFTAMVEESGGSHGVQERLRPRSRPVSELLQAEGAIPTAPAGDSVAITIVRGRGAARSSSRAWLTRQRGGLGRGGSLTWRCNQEPDSSVAHEAIYDVEAVPGGADVVPEPLSEPRDPPTPPIAGRLRTRNDRGGYHLGVGPSSTVPCHTSEAVESLEAGIRRREEHARLEERLLARCGVRQKRARGCSRNRHLNLTLLTY